MLLACLLLLLPQRLDPPKRVAHPGETVVLRAFAATGGPLRGVVVVATTPSGRIVRIGALDDAGTVSFVPEEAGRYEFQVDLPGGPRVIAVYHVVEVPARWLWALWLTPLGLWLCYGNLRRWRRPT